MNDQHLFTHVSTYPSFRMLLARASAAGHAAHVAGPCSPMISPTTMVMTRMNHSGDSRWAQNRLIEIRAVLRDEHHRQHEQDEREPLCGQVSATRLRFCGAGPLAATGLLAEVGRSVIEYLRCGNPAVQGGQGRECPLAARSFQKQPQRNHGRSAGPHPYWVIRLNCAADATELRDGFRIWPRSARSGRDSRSVRHDATRLRRRDQVPWSWPAGRRAGERAVVAAVMAAEHRDRGDNAGVPVPDQLPGPGDSDDQQCDQQVAENFCRATAVRLPDELNAGGELEGERHQQEGDQCELARHVPPRHMAGEDGPRPGGGEQDADDRQRDRPVPERCPQAPGRSAKSSVHWRTPGWRHPRGPAG